MVLEMEGYVINRARRGAAREGGKVGWFELRGRNEMRGYVVFEV